MEEGKGLVVWAGKIKVALFRREGVVYAIRNQCPHMGGDLGEGLLTGHVVRCPWHGWTFDVKTGVSPQSDLLTVRTFEVKIEGDDVYVAV